MTDRQLTAVEIFAGGGGLAVGLERAGFRAVAAIEVENTLPRLSRPITLRFKSFGRMFVRFLVLRCWNSEGDLLMS